MKTNMHTHKLDGYTIQELQRLQLHYSTMADHCTDVIKQLIGYTPDEFDFTFTIKGKAVLTIPITIENAQFCLGNFMAWAGHYKRLLREVNEQLNPQIKVA